MQQNARSECPKCSRPLQKFNGHIGYCPQHKWVSPIGLGFEAEAAEQNRQDAAAAEQSRLDQLRQEEEAKAQEIREQHQSAIRKVIAVVVALALIAAAVVFFVVRPSVNYGNATNKFTAGEYQAARDAYSALGSYKDSSARVLLCDAMIDLQEGRAEDAAAKLDQLTSEGQGDIAKQLADALLPVISDWKAKGLTPQALLLLLGKADIIDPNGTLDIAKLTEEGHAALLDGTQLSTYTADINGNGSAELIALNQDYSVTIYRMTADGNTRMSVDNDTVAACEMTFGTRYQDTDVDAAVACFSEAYRLLPNDDTRAALTAAYQLRSASRENAGNMDDAIADARNAMETAGTAEAFTFFYDINLRNCKNGHDAATTIAMWDAFAADAVTELTRFSAKDRWQADAAQFHIARAAELAAQKDEGCITELRTAAEMGADVTSAVAEAESHFEPGLSLARLRLMEIDLLGTDAAKEQEIRANMAGEVRTAISEWKSRGISPADVPALIHLADDQGIDLNGINRDAIYEEAAVASAGNVLQYSFVDWDADGYQKLITLDSSGTLALYGTNETWGIVSSIDTKLPNASYEIADESAPLILVLSSGRDEMLAVTGTSRKLNALFRETGISQYSVNGSTITFSRLLEGSIARYNDYTYEAVGTTNRPVRTGIDWQQNDYPQPANAAAAIQRYFEARAYDILDEAALLTTEPAVSGIFTGDHLASLVAPDVPGTVNATAYQTQDGRELFEVTYPAGAQTIRTWIAAEYRNGWKLTGASDTINYGIEMDNVDYSSYLVSSNIDITGECRKDSGELYRLYVPDSGRITFYWGKATGEYSASKTTIKLYSSDRSSYAEFEMSNLEAESIIATRGIYYFTVSPENNDKEFYRLLITIDTIEHVEAEKNDTQLLATPIVFGKGYIGMLSSSNDSDYFIFSLNEGSAINVLFESNGNSKNATAFVLTVLASDSNSILTKIPIMGNVTQTETGKLYLSSGSYLVQVIRGSTYTNEEYSLTVNIEQASAMELEPNNTPEIANDMPLNEDVHASIGQEGDVDCFTFTLDGDAVIQPKFIFTPTDSSSKTYVLTITDASRREMLKVNIGGKESAKVITPVALTAGTYTVKIENPRFVRQDYTLRLVSMAVDSAEKEPNDSSSLATDLVVSQPCTGVLTSGGDTDYYRIAFTEQSNVNLSFRFSNAAKPLTTFVLTIESNGKVLKRINVKGNSGGIDELLTFAAGEYFINVKPSEWSDSVYTICIQEQ